MNTGHRHSIDIRYWTAIGLASVLGTNLGDLYAHDSGLETMPGLALLGVLFAALFWAWRRGWLPDMLGYWAAIVLVRTAATNIADFSAYVAHVPMKGLVVGLALALAVMVGLARRAMPKDLPLNHGPLYWPMMLTAGVFGTVMGDGLSIRFGLETAAAALTAIWFVTLVAVPASRWSSPVGYWAVVALARTVGTAIGDWLAEGQPFALGLIAATGASGAALLLALVMLGRQLPGRLTRSAADGRQTAQ